MRLSAIPDRPQFRMEKYKKTAVRILKILLAIFAIAFCIFGYDVLYSFDIYSGKHRTNYYIGPVCFYSHIEETEYSLMLKEYGFSFRKAPEWKFISGHGFTLYYGTAHYCTTNHYYVNSIELASAIKMRKEYNSEKGCKPITKDAIERLLAYNIYLLSYSERGNYYSLTDYDSLGDEITPLDKTIDKDTIPPPKGYSEKLLDFVNFPDDYVH